MSNSSEGGSSNSTTNPLRFLIPTGNHSRQYYVIDMDQFTQYLKMINDADVIEMQSYTVAVDKIKSFSKESLSFSDFYAFRLQDLNEQRFLIESVDPASTDNE